MPVDHSVYGHPSISAKTVLLHCAGNRDASSLRRVLTGITQAVRRAGAAETALLLLGFASFVFAAGAVLAPLPGDTGWFLQSSGSLVVYLVATLFFVLHAVRGTGRARDWLWLGIMTAVLAAATIVYFEDPLVTVAGQTVDLGDALWFLAYAPAIVGLARISRSTSRGGALVAMLDAFLVGSGTFAIAGYVMASRIADAPSSLGQIDMLINTVSVLADVLLMAIALGAAQRFEWHPPAQIWWVFAAAGTFAVFDAEYAVRMILGTYVEGLPFDLGWPASVIMFMLAAYARPTEAWAPRDIDSLARNVIPGAFTVASALVLMVDVTGRIAPLVEAFAVLAVALAVVRMTMAVRRATGLASELRASRVDTLTGLPNRRALLAMGAHEVQGCALIELDLDGLGDINAHFGLAIGDAVLVNVTERIRGSVRIDDVVTRTGEDEFAILVRDATPLVATRIAELLVAALESTMTIEAHELTISACAGVSTQAALGTGADQLLVEASQALLEAQRLGTGMVRSFSGGEGERTQERLRTRSLIKEVLRMGGSDFTPYFQPIVDIQTNEVLAVEALVRWHRDGRVLLPGAFLDEVEGSGSMRALTSHVMREGMRALRSAGLDYPLAVNITPDLIDAELHDMVFDAVFGTQSRLEQLVLEVTEHAIMRDPAQAATVLGELRKDGVRVLLDDFGTGWSGLSSLRDLVVDGIKFDGSFISAMWSDRTTSTIVHGIVRVAEELGILVIYEGVEAPEHVEEFRRTTTGYLQGFGIARPMPIEDLTRWVQLRQQRGSNIVVD